MSITRQVGDIIREKIANTIKPVFDGINISFNSNDITNDFARFGEGGIEASFYIKGVDNVVRKDFNAQVALLRSSNLLIEDFKVKFKRPEKEVRFYLKVKNENS